MPSSATTAVSALSRSRIGASRLRPVDGMWRVTQTAAVKPAGSPATTARMASTPPADAAMPMTRAGGAHTGCGTDSASTPRSLRPSVAGDEADPSVALQDRVADLLQRADRLLAGL